MENGQNNDTSLWKNTSKKGMKNRSKNIKKLYLLTSKTAEDGVLRRAALTDKTLSAVPQFVDLVAFSTERKIAKSCMHIHNNQCCTVCVYSHKFWGRGKLKQLDRDKSSGEEYSLSSRGGVWEPIVVENWEIYLSQKMVHSDANIIYCHYNVIIIYQSQNCPF